MRRFLIVMAVCAVLCGASVRGIGKEAASKAPAAKAPAPAKPPARQKLPAGFSRLFDGKTLKGWKGREALWKVDRGAIRGQITPETKLKHNDFLYTLKEYGDFELRLKFRLINHNSGVQIRSQVHKDYRVTGYQADIAERRFTGILYEEGGRGILADVDQKKIARHVKKGDWNDYRILCQGKRVQFWINGQPTISYTEKKASAPTKGVIAFQLHGGPPMKVYFKDVIIKELSKPRPKEAIQPTKKTVLFNGKDLTGWVRFIPNDKKGTDGKWTADKVWSVKDGVIHCIGKPSGYIRTEDSYADYKLHLEWRWTDKPTNSGVLLHRAGIDRVWPKCIEAQLMHQNAGDFWIIGGATIKHGGTVKKGHGPKKNPSNEKAPGEWNKYDIICDGGTVKLTVNGLLQNEGTDANPSSGPICLQSEGSGIEFRNIYLEPLGKGKPAAGKDQVVFEDRFEAKPAEGWTWLRENPKAWRVREGALEIRVEPGVARNVKNALVRAAPDRSKGTYAIEVTVTNTTKPTRQFEQAGITWYHNGKPIFKLVKELIGGKLYIIPGAKPMDSKSVQLRLIVTAKGWTAQYRPDGKGEYLTAAKGRLPAPGKDQVSIQCYNGPPDAEHWIGFDDFRILKLPD